MSIVKKISSLVIALAMVLSMTVSAAALPTDVVGTKYEEAANLLSALDIMVGDGTNFNAEANVTRAEIAKILACAMGYGSVAEAYSPKGVFTDVATSEWYAPYVEFCYGIGAISGYGDGKFGPNDNVTGEQAVTLFTHATGHSVQAADLGGYPSGYVTAARDAGLLATITSLDLTQPMKRGDVAVLCYNALKTDLLVQVSSGSTKRYESHEGETLLTERHKVYTANGVVISNDVTALGEISTIDDGYVTISTATGNFVLKAGETDLSDKLGTYVRAYYKWDDESEKGTILAYKVSGSKNDQITIDIEDLILGESTNTKVVYNQDEDDDKNRDEIIIADEPSLIHNGATETGYGTLMGLLNSIEDMKGEVTFLKNSAGKIYSTVMVTTYRTFVVNVADQEKYLISDKLDKNNIFEADLDSASVLYSITDKNGNAMQFSDISKGDAVYISASSDASSRRMIKMIVSNEKVSGLITEVDEDKDGNLLYTLDNDSSKTYKLGKKYYNYITNNGRGEMSFGLNDSVEFTIDPFGEIAYHEGAAINVNGTYAFIYKYVKYDDDEEIVLKALTEDGAIKKFTLADKVKIDGVKYKEFNEAFDALDFSIKKASSKAGGYFTDSSVYASLAIIETDSEGRITYIDTPYTTDDESEYTLRSPKGAPSGFQNLQYNAQAKAFKFKYFVNASGLRFNIPEKIADIEDSKKATVTKQSGFVGEENYNIQMFNTDPNSYSLGVVIVKTKGAGGDEYQTGASESARRQRPNLAVAKVSIVRVDPEDDEYTIKVYGNQEGSNVEVLVDPDYYDSGAALTHTWQGGKDKKFKDLVTAYKDAHDGEEVPAERAQKIFMTGDLFEYGVNSDGYISYILPKYLAGVNWIMSDTEGKITARRYQAGDFIQVVEYDGTYVLAREIERNSAINTGVQHAVMALDVDDGYVLKDSDGNDLVTMVDGRYQYTNEGLTSDIMFDPSALKSIVVYDASESGTSAISSGSVADIFDTEASGKPATYAHLRIFNSMVQSLYIIKF